MTAKHTLPEATVPAEVVDLESFRRWVASPDYPDGARAAYLAGAVWFDMSREQLFSHNQVKGAVAITLAGLASSRDLGLYFHDRCLLTNDAVSLSCQPDGTFVAWPTLDSARVQLVEGTSGGFVELQGSPDMVLEVVSDSSVEKDTVTLRRLYWKAGVREYWLIDAREDLRFEVFRYTSRGYVRRRLEAGWVKSAVFGKSFPLVSQPRRGYPQYALQTQ